MASLMNVNVKIISMKKLLAWKPFFLISFPKLFSYHS